MGSTSPFSFTPKSTVQSKPRRVLRIFAIMGINFFKGSFYHCEFVKMESAFSNANSLSQPAVQMGIKSSHDCADRGGEWVNMRSNFDDIVKAMICLFEMMTTEGWMKVMY